MSEPSWELLGGGGVLGPAGIDYIGPWAAGTQYQPGQIVRYGGVDYLAVNPSLGQTPPVASPLFGGIGTTLPVSPVDGMEAILVSSLTAPSWSWRFRYVASITDAYKWLYVGGAPAFDEVLTNETRASNVYGDCPTVGPQLTIPLAGAWHIGWGCYIGPVSSTDNIGYMGISYGGAAVIENDDAVMSQFVAGGAGYFIGHRWHERRKTVTAANTLAKAQYRGSASVGAQFGWRRLMIEPIRVSG